MCTWLHPRYMLHVSTTASFSKHAGTQCAEFRYSVCAICVYHLLPMAFSPQAFIRKRYDHGGVYYAVLLALLSGGEACSGRMHLKQHTIRVVMPQDCPSHCRACLLRLLIHPLPAVTRASSIPHLQFLPRHCTVLVGTSHETIHSYHDSHSELAVQHGLCMLSCIDVQ